MRIEGVGLEHHREIALAGGQVVDDAPGDGDGAVGDLLEPGDHPQQRGFAATGRPDENEELAWLHLEIDAVDHRHVAVGLDHVAEGYARHAGSLVVHLRPLMAMPRMMSR
jgi:hypothetical protein